MIIFNISIIAITLLLVITQRIQTIKCINRSKKEVYIANTYLNILKLRNKFNLLSRKNKFSNCPYIRKYISNSIDLFLVDNIFNIDNIHPKYGKSSNEYFKKISIEIDNANKDICEILSETLDIVNDIIYIKRPFLHKFMTLKKMTSIKILSFFLYLCEKLFALLVKLEEFTKKIQADNKLTRLFNVLITDYLYIKNVSSTQNRL